MKECHPSREILELFALGDLPVSEAAEVERHLEVCSDCRDRADEVSSLLSLPLLDWLGSQYDNAFDRALRGAAEQLAGLKSESRNAEVLLAELLREPVPERRRKIREDERFHSLKLCQLLRTRSHDHWFSDPSVSLELAGLAADLAQYLDHRRYGVGLLEDVRALSWASLSNAFKLSSDLWRAEMALRQAWSHYEQSCGDVHTKVELLNFTTALKIAQGRFPEAVRLTDQAIEVHPEGQQPHLEGLMLIMRAQALGNNGRYREAIATASTAIGRIGAQSPHLLLTCRHNMIFFLFRHRALKEARQLLKETRPLYSEIGDRLFMAHLRWVEGQFAEEIDRADEAEAALDEARHFFIERRNGCEVVRISLDLAWVYARSRRLQQARRTLDEAIPLGEALGLRRETLKARLLYAQASKG